MFLRLLLLAVSVLASGQLLAANAALAPQAGYYRMRIGDFQVTALSDGTLALPVDRLLQGTTPENVKRALRRNFLGLPTETSFNAFLVDTGAKQVLIDSGAGGSLGPTLGSLVANLRAAGYSPEQIDEIYLTHMHPDHVGGLAAEGRAVFPNAVVRADQREADFWLSAAEKARASDDKKEFFSVAASSLEPYIGAGRFRPFHGAVELVAGVRAVPTHGHTPGHTSYLIESKGEKLLVLGDLIHVAAVQFADPSVTISFDDDPRGAERQRKKRFAEAARRGWWIAGAHLSFPGIGHLRADGKGYVFVPANYSTH